MESQDVHTNPTFVDHTATTQPIIESPAAKTEIEPPAAKTEIKPPAAKGKPIFSNPANKSGRWTHDDVKRFYKEDKAGLLKEYGIDPETFKLLYTNQKLQLDYLYRVMNGDELPHKHALIANPENATQEWINKEYDSKKLKQLNEEAYPTTPNKKGDKTIKKKSEVDALIPIIQQYDPPTVNISEYLAGSSADPIKYFKTDD